jgi:hypothetical protein
MNTPLAASAAAFFLDPLAVKGHASKLLLPSRRVNARRESFGPFANNFRANESIASVRPTQRDLPPPAPSVGRDRTGQNIFVVVRSRADVGK